jgi:hypothetical protein
LGWLSRLLHWLISASRWLPWLLLCAWQALDNDSDPPLNMQITLRMVLNDSITLPNCFSSEFNNFIDKSLNYSDAKIIILRLIFVINTA